MEENRFDQEREKSLNEQFEERGTDYTPEYDDYQDQEQNEAAKKALRGYRIVIILLAVILAGISILYFQINKRQQAEYAQLEVARDEIQGELNNMISEYDTLKVHSDSMAMALNEAQAMVAHSPSFVGSLI